MDRNSAQTWLDAYVSAWTSYDAGEIAALFTEDVVYRYHPNDDPITGADAVVASWLGESDEAGSSTRDAPGTFHASYSPVAIDGDTVVATGTTTYRDDPGGPVTRMFDNCFVMRFDDRGRCSAFVEYYNRRSGSDDAAAGG